MNKVTYRFLYLCFTTATPLVATGLLLWGMSYSTIALAHSDTIIEPKTVTKNVLTATTTAQDCEVYPFAFPEYLFDPSNVPAQFEIFEGAAFGGLGWLRWNPSENDANYILNELQNPALSLYDFSDPTDSSDHSLSIGDYVNVAPGIFLSNDIEVELEQLINNETMMRVVAFDTTVGSGSNVSVHSTHFAFVKLNSYATTTPFAKTFTFLGYGDDPETCRNFGLQMTPSQSQTGVPGQVLTFTHILTNQGDYTETATLIHTSSYTDWQVTLNLSEQVLAPKQASTVTLIITIPVSSSTGVSHTSYITSFLGVKPTVLATVIDSIDVVSAVKLQVFVPVILKQ